MTDKVRENRLRRMADRQGLALQKSRRRDPHAFDFGTYWLVDPYNNALVAGDEWGWELDDIEEWLTQPASDVSLTQAGATLPKPRA
jgi:hypothetical protein